MWLLTLCAISLIQNRADIYHAHDVSGLPACYIAARLRNKPLIFDAHELPLAEISNGLFRRMKSLLVWILTSLVSHCAGVITVSSPIAQEICRKYHARNLTLVRNVPAYQPAPKSERLREQLGLSSKKRIALYQGVLQSNRGLDKVIRAAPFLDRDIVIVIMGQGEMESQLKSLIASEGVADRVKILPPVPYEELLDWTASADLRINRLFTRLLAECTNVSTEQTI